MAFFDELILILQSVCINTAILALWQRKKIIIDACLKDSIRHLYPVLVCYFYEAKHTGYIDCFVIRIVKKVLPLKQNKM